MSENDNCHCAGTTEVVTKVMGRNAWRDKPWSDLEKQTYRVRTWHVEADSVTVPLSGIRTMVSMSI